MTARVRQVIRHLSYQDLLEDHIIPDMETCQDLHYRVTKAKYPPFVHTSKKIHGHQNFSYYGIFMEYVIRAGLRLYMQRPIIDKDDTFGNCEMYKKYSTSTNFNDIARAANLMTAKYCKLPAYGQDVIDAHVGTLVNILKDILSHWHKMSHYFDASVIFGHEYCHDLVSGHPDIVVGQTILDVKNTCSLEKMNRSAYLQILAYYALAQAEAEGVCDIEFCDDVAKFSGAKDENVYIRRSSVKCVGLLLPMQRSILIYDLSQWDYKPYLNMLQQYAVLYAINPMLAMIPDYFLDSMELPREIGSHVGRDGTIANSLKYPHQSKPVASWQMFLRNPQSGKLAEGTPGQIAEAAKYIRDNNIKYFTHAAYIINLSSSETYQQKYLNEDLAYTAALNGSGVVVHTGARVKRTTAVATDNMEQMVRNALDYATESCPLLLETPCGEGTEICTVVTELADFFRRFTPEERKKLGLCVDTCHVFASGVKPLDYMKMWVELSDVPIRLIHFNDSQGCQGCKVDRHEGYHIGRIGKKRMIEVAEWALQRGIAMVRE